MIAVSTLMQISAGNAADATTLSCAAGRQSRCFCRAEAAYRGASLPGSGTPSLGEPSSEYTSIAVASLMNEKRSAVVLASTAFSNVAYADPAQRVKVANLPLVSRL